MTFFTPELLARFRSNDEDVAEVAADEWERQSEAYAEQWQYSRQTFPKCFVQFLENYYLHDAEVVAAWQEDDTFKINLRLDTPPRQTLLLTYELAFPPTHSRHAGLSAGYGPVHWLYDEAVRFKYRDSMPFGHVILLSDGLELKIGFDDFRFTAIPNNQVFVSGACTANIPTVGTMQELLPQRIPS